MRKFFGLHIHVGLLVPVMILILLSLTTLFSIHSDFFKNQLLFVGISFLVYIFSSQINTKFLEMYSIPLYILSLIVLTIVLLIGIESRGAVRWIDILGFRIQFSEIFKPFLGVSLAAFLSSKKPSFSTLIQVMVFTLPIFFLIYKQPDLGSALIYVGVVMVTLLVFGVSYVWYLGGVAIIAVSVPFLWNFLHDYQKQRITTFFSPSSDPLGTSYNVIQAVIAVGSGLIVGKGLNETTQSGLRFLPERHTDFIFATLSEGLGFVGSVAIIVLFVWLLFVIYRIFVLTDNEFAKIFSLIAFFVILIQFFVNIGMNIGLLPIVGITLPFVSYGGSSLLSNFIFLGLLTSIAKKDRSHHALEIR